MKRRGIAAAVLMFALVPAVAWGQVFFDAPLGPAGVWLQGDGWIDVRAYVSAGDGSLCSSREAVLQATAERALRQDGITVRREVPAFLSLIVGVTSLETTVGGVSTGCATSIEIDLHMAIDLNLAAGLLTVRVFTFSTLLVGPRGDMGDRVRRTVEDEVSTLANRLRLELDAAARERR
jgi:hypothetical protein